MQQHRTPRKQKYTPPPSHLFSSLRRSNSYSSNSDMAGKSADVFIPHKGALYRVESQDSYAASYVIEIHIPQVNDDSIDFVNDTSKTRELHYSSNDFKVMSRLFAILDTDNINLVNRNVVKDFVYKRCPVFTKRDDDLMRLLLHASRNDLSTSSNEKKQSTFDEIWTSVVACSRSESSSLKEATCVGIEGWLVFCRFIALTQYLEAKRRFSARHSQRNSALSEVIMVDVPPPVPPTAITPLQLSNYEDRNTGGLPLPELDLDHTLLAAHDLTARRRSVFHDVRTTGDVKIALFGSSSDTSTSNNLEFAVSYTRRSKLDSSIVEYDEGVVRRSMNDMKWLDDTFTSHRVLGGTLCGRILPPFPSTALNSGVLSTHFQNDESSFTVNTSSIKSSTGGAINAAAIGVGRIRDAAKSLISPLSMLINGSPTDVRSDDVVATTSGSHYAQHSSKKLAKKKRNISLALPENYYNPNSPVGKARQIERYLNYLLEHPALSTSFPLNAILTASQSGLEAAREILAECVRSSKELKEQSPHVYDGKSATPNFGWVRTVAQAAMALQVHGILENTGMPSASARLQHASLPAFGSSARVSGWDDLDVSSSESYAISNGDIPHAREVLSFEDGVVNDEGFDLLPLPVPAPERRILTVGNTVTTKTSEASPEERFHYGSGNIEHRYPIQLENDHGSAFLGDIVIDENIDKLREVIGSVDNTFSRCLISSGDIGKGYQERYNQHIKVIRGLDSWEGMRGRFIGQRSLLQGVAGVEYSREICQDSYLALIDDLSWQTALASSAVTAAEDVRGAVRVARTASNARAAASSASLTAQAACERGEFANLEEARAAQTRASIAQSHAIHAAVVEYEAKTVKRRATLALANDVETWNIHRKKEMLRSCIAFARSQHEVARRNVDAWSTLRDGYIGASMNPSIAERKLSAQTIRTPVSLSLTPEPPAGTAPSEVSSAALHDSHHELEGDRNSTHYIAEGSNDSTLPAVDEEEDCDTFQYQAVDPNSSDSGITKSTEDVQGDMFLLPFAEAAPIAMSNGSDLLSFDQWDGTCSSSQQHQSSMIHESQHQQQLQHESSFTDETMGESMQSIVNSIINKWGLGFESDDDHLALPVGMAASILLEDDHHSLTNPNGTSFNIV